MAEARVKQEKIVSKRSVSQLFKVVEKGKGLRVCQGFLLPPIVDQPLAAACSSLIF